ncbi:heme exporter protein CcmD [Roseovarius atlanticus]|nr:heme exporter protein CcmD [Roseovarius atlanticus]MBY5988362.1 heme exporter protein CcmD [Roseovarius atlanticus]MBY6123753.1 heme exporter protein CcmD [Roseovarius atlanticus]MBY6148248.1 heme exporter protein CcmD [Roseovarius atlanticus]
MMPELGKYAEAVLSSYAVSLVLLIALVVFSWRRSVRVKNALKDVERKRKMDV